MKQCRKCGVHVDDDLANCPLCGAFAHDETTPTIYEYPEVNIKTKKKLLLKISLFASIFTMVLVLAINIAVNKTVSWSLHVIFGFALVWMCISRPIIKRFNVRKYLTWGFIGAIALLFYINIWTSRLANPWAFNLGAPIVILVWQSVLEILIFAHKGGRGNYQISLTKLFVLSAICIGISFLWTGTCIWSWYVCTAIGFVDVLALSFFAKETYFGELKRRLHI